MIKNLFFKKILPLKIKPAVPVRQHQKPPVAARHEHPVVSGYMSEVVSDIPEPTQHPDWARTRNQAALALKDLFLRFASEIENNPDLVGEAKLATSFAAVNKLIAGYGEWMFGKNLRHSLPFMMPFKKCQTDISIREALKQTLLRSELRRLRGLEQDLVRAFKSLPNPVEFVEKINDLDYVLPRYQVFVKTIGADNIQALVSHYKTFDHMRVNLPKVASNADYVRGSMSHAYAGANNLIEILVKLNSLSGMVLEGGLVNRSHMSGIHRAFELNITSMQTFTLSVRPSIGAEVETTPYYFRMRPNGDFQVSTSDRFSRETSKMYSSMRECFQDIKATIAQNPKTYAELQCALLARTGLENCTFTNEGNVYRITFPSSPPLLLRSDDNGFYEISDGHSVLLKTMEMPILKDALREWGTVSVEESALTSFDTSLTSIGYTISKQDPTQIIAQKGKSQCTISVFGKQLVARVQTDPQTIQKAFISSEDAIKWVAMQTEVHSLYIPPRPGKAAQPISPKALFTKLVDHHRYEAALLSLDTDLKCPDKDAIKILSALDDIPQTPMLLTSLLKLFTRFSSQELADGCKGVISAITGTIARNWGDSPEQRIVQSAAQTLLTSMSPYLFRNARECIAFIQSHTIDNPVLIRSLLNPLPLSAEENATLYSPDHSQACRLVLVEKGCLPQHAELLHPLLEEAMGAHNSEASRLLFTTLFNLPENADKSGMDLITEGGLGEAIIRSQDIGVLKALFSVLTSLNKTDNVADFFYASLSFDPSPACRAISLYLLGRREVSVRGGEDSATVFLGYLEDAIYSFESGAPLQELLDKLAFASSYLKQPNMVSAINSDRYFDDINTKMDRLLEMHDRYHGSAHGEKKISTLCGAILSKIFRLFVEGGTPNTFDFGSKGIFKVFTDIDHADYPSVVLRMLTHKGHIGEEQFKRFTEMYHFQEFKAIKPGDDGWYLGQGSFGTVQAGYILGSPDDEVMAVKVVHKDSVSDGDLARSVHPNVVSAKGHFLDTSTKECHILFALGRNTLAQELRSKKLNPLRSTELAHKLIMTMYDLNCTLGIFLRDLKLDNILVTLEEGGKYTVKISDLGLAVHDDGSGVTTEMAGTGAYFTPQMLRDYMTKARGTYNLAEQDLRTLFVTLLQLMMGKEDGITTLSLMDPDDADVQALSAYLNDTSRIAGYDGTVVPARPAPVGTVIHVSAAPAAVSVAAPQTPQIFFTSAQLPDSKNPIWWFIRLFDRPDVDITSFNQPINIGGVTKPLIAHYQEKYARFMASQEDHFVSPQTSRKDIHASPPRGHQRARSVSHQVVSQPAAAAAGEEEEYDLGELTSGDITRKDADKRT